MSQLRYSATITGNSDPRSLIVSGKVLTHQIIGEINTNGKFAAARLETFFLGYFKHGDTVGLGGAGVQIVSPVDGYAYTPGTGINQDTIIYDFHLYTTRAPSGSGFTSGMLTTPPISSSQAGSPYWWTANIDSSAVVQLHVNYDGSTGSSNDGILKVYAHCQRQSTMFFSPTRTFSDVPEGRLCFGQPLRVSDLQALNSNSVFGSMRKEVFDQGFWKAGSAVTLPVSPVDSCAYARDEIRYKALFYTNLASAGGFANGQTTVQTLMPTFDCPPTHSIASCPTALSRAVRLVAPLATLVSA